MTPTNTQQLEALQLAYALRGGKLIDDSTEWADTLHAAEAELLRQHARIAELEALLSAIGAGGVEPLRKQAEDGWIQDGFLLYRLTDEPRPRNRDEINVTMANSSRTVEARTRRASELLDAIRAAAPQAAAHGMDAPNEWEEIHTLPTCDDLIWLYCQDTNTTDGPIAPEPSLEQYGWTHWAYANAPSTAWIDAAQAKKEGEKK